jgi:hypothetical protein
MSLLFDVISAIILATIGCGATYWYLDNQGYEEKKVPYSIMVFLIVLFVILSVMYQNFVSAWVHSLFTSSVS